MTGASDDFDIMVASGRTPAGRSPVIRDLRTARASLREDTRSSILAAAASLMSEEGVAALTVRRVAEAVNASTKVIYTSFGGKDGLLDALYLHSFAGLGEALGAQQQVGDPVARLRAMCHAYRRYALAEPALYNVMFGDLGRDYAAPLSSRKQAWLTFRTMRDAVRICLPPDRKTEDKDVTRMVWAAMHGIVSLEMRGLMGEPAQVEALFSKSIEALFIAHGIDNR